MNTLFESVIEILLTGLPNVFVTVMFGNSFLVHEVKLFSGPIGGYR